MTCYVRNMSCYKYCEESRTSTVFRCPYPGTKQTIIKDETGLVDLKEKNVKQSIQLVKLNSDGNFLYDQEIETILIKNKLYNEMSGKWSMSVVSDPIKSFDERNKLRGIVDLISSSDIEVIGTETVDGEKCYKLKVVPEQNTIRGILAIQALAVQSSVPITLPIASFEDLSESDPLVDNSDISYTVWLTADKCVPKKMDAEINFALTPASMKVGSESMSNFRIDATVKDTLVLSDFDAPSDITVPGVAR